MCELRKGSRGKRERHAQDGSASKDPYLYRVAMEQEHKEKMEAKVKAERKANTAAAKAREQRQAEAQRAADEKEIGQLRETLERNEQALRRQRQDAADRLASRQVACLPLVWAANRQASSVRVAPARRNPIRQA